MIVEKNGRLYGKGTGLGGSAVVNPNIFIQAIIQLILLFGNQNVF